MSWLKSLTKSLLLQFIENPHSRDSIRAEIHLEQRRGKLILLVLLFTELLKFALLKNSQVKSTKSKIFCERTDTHKKSLFPELKRKFQIFKYPSGSALKVPGTVCLKLPWIGNVFHKYEKKKI